MAFFRDLKNLLTTGSRAPGGEGPGEELEDSKLDAEAVGKETLIAADVFHTAGPDFAPGDVDFYDEGRPRK